jgi:putative ABC transport system permease protein
MDMLMGIRRDLALAVRSLLKARAFTFVCVVSLGIGMAPVIAVPYGARMFSAPPSGLKTDGLIEVVTTSEGPRQAANQWSYPDFEALRDVDTGAALTGWSTGRNELSRPPAQGGRFAVRSMYVSSNYFDVIGVPMAQGAGFRETPDLAVVLSHAFWQRHMGADPAALGQVLVIDSQPHTVVGIAREWFGGHLGFHEFDLFLPLDRHPLVLADTTVRFDRGREWVNIHGRLSSGVALAQASAAVGTATKQIATEHPATNEFKSGIVVPYHAVGSLEADQLRLITAVGQALTVLPLLVVCLNIAGMVQVRSAMRERELSIRQAIGASRGRLMQQLLAESFVLAAAGATLASMVLFNIVPLASWWANEPLPPRLAAALQVDLQMIAICVGLCVITSLVCGWLPAARFSRPAIITVLKDDAGVGRARAGRVHRVATALQVAIATPLLVLGTMTLDRVRATATNDVGFDAELLYAAPLPLGPVNADTVWSRMQGARDMLARTSGVSAVTITDGLPLDFRYRITRVATQVDDNVAPTVVSAHVTRIGEGYFDTMGIPLLRGRDFDRDDVAGAGGVTILTTPLAERLFPAEDPLGKRITFATGDDAERTLTVVGVSADFPTSQMSTNRAQLLLPLAQYRDVIRDSVQVNDDRGGTAHLMLVIRSAPGESAGTMTAALDTTLRDLDPEFDPTGIVTGAGLRQKSVRDFLGQSMVAGVVGGVLLMLSALGIYGVVGLMVATRIREIAVRVALGATRRRVVSLVLADVVRLVTPGVAVGLLIAVAFVRLNGEDFGIALSGLEPLAYVVGAGVAVLVAVLAGLAPARRAASIQPMVAMKSE